MRSLFYLHKPLFCSVLAILCLVQLSGCASVVVGVEPSPTPEQLTYTNQEHGFSFSYPITWTLDQAPQKITLTKDAAVLSIYYRWENEDWTADARRSGMPAGDFLYDDKLLFLGQVIPVERLEYEHKAKAVFYNGIADITINQLVFNLSLEDIETDYLKLDLDENTQEEAKVILQSFTLIPATTKPLEQNTPLPEPARENEDEINPMSEIEWTRYDHNQHAFSIYYPADMQLSVEEQTLYLTDKTMEILIHLGADQIPDPLTRQTELGGELLKYKPIELFDQPVMVSALLREGRPLALFYGAPGFGIMLNDFEISIEAHAVDPAVGLPEGSQELLEQLLQSISFGSS
ncbi:MAG: hypothetical protein JW750_12495 [Anaerolineaceae bacterium]|nr:hypothetical protein [Anaerolineaceae bacterium]